MFHFVQWVDENPITFSVVSSQRLIDGTKRHSAKLQNEILDFKLKQGTFRGLIIRSGENEKQLENHADGPAEFQALKDGQQLSDVSPQPYIIKKESKAKVNSRNRKFKVHSIVSQLPSSDNETHENQPGVELKEELLGTGLVLSADFNLENYPNNHDVDSVLAVPNNKDLKLKYTNMKAKKEKYKKRYNDLKATHALCSDDAQIELVEGSGVFLKNSEISSFEHISASETVFARNLFRRLFHPEELVGVSLLGRKSTNDRTHAPLPSIDPARRNTIIDFSLSKFGYGGARDVLTKKERIRRKAGKRQITKSLSDFIREQQPQNIAKRIRKN